MVLPQRFDCGVQKKRSRTGKLDCQKKYVSKEIYFLELNHSFRLVLKIIEQYVCMKANKPKSKGWICIIWSFTPMIHVS